MRYCERIGIAILVLLSLAGCSSDSRVAADGAVSLDGKPLESGGIAFLPIAGGHSAGGQIQNGRFHIPANHGLSPGKYRVTIQAFRPTGRMVVIDEETGGKTPEQVEIRYRERGTLEAVVVAGKTNQFNFQLNSIN